MKQSSTDPYTIQFLGAAGTVTGSKYLITTPETKIMIDCGLFQGLKHLRELNWMELPVPAATIDYVFLTHAHLDHSGYLPRLVKQGFKGKIWCTYPSADLAEIILKDSAKIQEEDAEHANRHGYSKHTPALPLYDLNDLHHTLPLFQPQADNQWITIKSDIRIRFRKNSHIPGAAFIELEIKDKRLVFSGDVGRPGDPMLGPPERPNIADVLLIESTYGGRIHSHDSPEQSLKDIILDATKKNGIIIIPSFTVDRAQDFMFILWKLRKKHQIPELPVYLDSPMGINVSKVFLDYPEWHKLGEKTFREVFKSVNLVRSIDETYALAEDAMPKIIIAGSGMMNGGRILHYLTKHLSNPLSTIIIPGYQAEGTRGRMLHDGAKEIKIHGSYYEVKATIKAMTTMSSHADQNELLDWVSVINKKPDQVFIVHGEPQSANMLRVKLKDTRGWDCTIPHLIDQFWLNID